MEKDNFSHTGFKLSHGLTNTSKRMVFSITIVFCKKINLPQGIIRIKHVFQIVLKTVRKHKHALKAKKISDIKK